MSSSGRSETDQNAGEAARITRRTVLATASAAAFVPLATLTPWAQAQEIPTALTAAELRLLEAFMDRIIPEDDNGPGAVQAGAANYVDRILADWLSNEKDSIAAGLAATDAYARRAYGMPFADLSDERRDQVLTALEAGEAEGFADSQNFFNRARRLTIEGMFSDPYYGGNKDFAGWDLIGYPGALQGASADLQKMGERLKPLHTSAYGANGGH
jgi:gluconate 2-dehydrogenase gamma chain